MSILAGLRLKSGGAILLCIVAAAALSVPSLGAAAAVSTRSSSWPSQVAHPAPASCPRGATLIMPTSGWTDALGVAHFRFRAAPGLVANLPPRGLTTARVTSAMIKDVGLPTGHTVGPLSKRRLIEQVLNLAEHQTAPAFCRSKALPDEELSGGQPSSEPLGSSGREFTHAYSYNWAGYEVTEAENGDSGINGVDGSWTVGHSMTSLAPSVSATWVGVGGGNGDGSSVYGLIQDGTSVQTNEGYRSWFEYVGSSGGIKPVYSSVDAVHPGDSVTGEVWWNTSTSACFYFTDWTAGTGDISTCMPVNVPYDHTSAEWINENQLNYNVKTELLYGPPFYDNPGTIHWTDQAMSEAFDGNGPWFSPFSGSFEAIVMKTGPNPAGSPACGASEILSYPIDAATESSGGSSATITCAVAGLDSP